MTFEELIRRSVTAGSLTWESKDSTFMVSIYTQLCENQIGLTSKQVHVCQKILRKVGKQLAKSIKANPDDYARWVDKPDFERDVRISVTKRNEVRYVGDNLLAFSCNHTDDIRNFTKENRASFSEGMMTVQINSSNFDNIIKLIAKMSFEMDSDTEDYLALCMASKNDESHFIVDGGVIVCNICDNEVLGAFVIQVLDGTIV